MAATFSPGESQREPHAPTDAAASGARGDADHVQAGSRSSASSDDHVAEKAALSPLSKREKVRRHCHRFWLWYLIATIVLLAILLPILFKVIVPAIVQAIINSQALPIHGGLLDVVTSDLVKMGVDTTLHVPLPARTTNFSMSLFRRDTSPYSPYVTLNVAGQRINGDTNFDIPGQLLTVENHTEFVHWLGEVFDQEEVDISLRGVPTVYLGALRSEPTLDKTTKMPGLRKFAGLSIQKLQLMLPPDKDGNNIKGTVNIPNWSLVVLNFGNITFNMFSGAVQIGHLTVYNNLLNPGNNSLSFDGNLDLAAVVKNLRAVLDSQSEALSRGQINLNVTGISVVKNGNQISYIAEVLRTRYMTATMSVISLVGDVFAGIMDGGTAGAGVPGGGTAGIVNILGDVLGNNTFIDHVLQHFNATRLLKGSSTGGSPLLSMRAAANPKEALMWKMVQMGLRRRLNLARSGN
ncbi:uncharacterized protein UV8b_04669 [Ustilaginoidea virens]|uniref:Uncharacterized protein n=1 Tax=Ustilaginoidea virens TaxID=1159556 RepID=A0A063BZG8_USTVR|nr:uncharacterized protein UV8b_04669 [Ustilaginoidea virens]QUC20428.1 hypothetical protein UV8b_04669 [Ustilaginoidea virens]GAO15169.1 hypothetical protein UVI_02029330 [Ustilaginoidea virens]